MLCDDDALVRSVIRQVLQDSPIEVVGEAEYPEEAKAIILDSDANIVVLDLALRGGSGEALLRWMREQDRAIHAVVYSAYAGDPRSLLDAGASAVIDKPDFEKLHAAVDGIAAAIGLQVDRRRAQDRRPPPMPAPTAVSLGGFEPWASFLSALEHAATGDAILCVDIVAAPLLEDRWDHAFGLDHRIALGRAMGSARRVGDRISLTPKGRPALLLVGGHADAPAAVFDRLSEQWSREPEAGTPVGAFGLVHESDDPLERLVVIEAAVTADRSNPLRTV